MDGFIYNGKGYTAKNCYFEKNSYAENRNLRLDIFGDCGLGGAEPVVTVTLNIGKTFPENVVALNCYLEEDDNLLKEMVKLGLVSKVLGVSKVGRVTVPVCELNPSMIELYSY